MGEWKRQAILIAVICWLTAGCYIYGGVVRRDSFYVIFALLPLAAGTFMWKRRR